MNKRNRTPDTPNEPVPGEDGHGIRTVELLFNSVTPSGVVFSSLIGPKVPPLLGD